MLPVIATFCKGIARAQYTFVVADKRHIFLGIVKVALNLGAEGEMRRWERPEGTSELRLYNSLTKEKNDFVPQKGKQVSWYSCGPTVYDASHMGHARSYITFDILRRVMMNYFNYDVYYVMNVTDVDDKIIHRARRNHLIKKYEEANYPMEKVLADVKEAMELYHAKLEKTKDEDKRNMLLRIMERVGKKVEEAKTIQQENTSLMESRKKALLDACKDPMSELLDKQFKGQVVLSIFHELVDVSPDAAYHRALEVYKALKKMGATITDHSIFSELTQHWEKDYHDDMKALNVLPADVLTRVSQYVPEIVTYIQNIIDNGFGYVSEGSVYFDTMKFASSDEHQYAKLVPEAVGDLDALAEGEGELSHGGVGEKKSERDFALWKASKPGEPFWDSPWGKGRPGWHIECSVMASDVLGSSIDIHTGGVDLKFPHHDNELAQAEAHYKCNQWIHYFLHAGHLTIEGCKMSKSLKNFITIKDALKKNTARQIRFAFLLHAWNATLDYSTNVLKEAEQTEKLFNDFFLAVKDILRKTEVMSPGTHNFKGAEKELQEQFTERKSQVHKALCDSIDTPLAVQHMQSLVKLSNIYMARKREIKESPSHCLLKSIAQYLTKMLKIFGANDGEQDIGFPSAAAGEAAANVEEMVLPYVDVLSQFREEVRKVAKEEKVTRILQLCDDLRDNQLIDLGVKLEDQEGGHPAVVKFVDKEILYKEREQKQKEAEERKKQKEEVQRKKAEEQAAKEAKAKIPPSEMFKNDINEYSQFDEQGIPTHDKSGEKLSASAVKKLKKLHAQQEKIHAKYLATLSQNPTKGTGQ